MTYFTIKDAGILADKAVDVKFFKSGEIRVSVGSVVRVREIIQFILHVFLDFAFTASVLKFNFAASVLENLLHTSSKNYNFFLQGSEKYFRKNKTSSRN